MRDLQVAESMDINRNRGGRYLLLLGASLIALQICADITQAQEKVENTEKAEVKKDNGENLEEIVVTGSRIKGAAATGAIAVSILDRETLDAFGASGGGDLLSNLAQAGAIQFNDSSDTPNAARGDVASVNLRELGGGNTLVMLNGRRLVNHPTAQDISSTPQSIVNANMLPVGGARRLEVLRDGASALYGADATAGVVNTVMDTSYEGLALSLRYDDSEQTDYSALRFRLNGGVDLNEGKTHINFYGNYYDRDGVYSNNAWPSTARVDKRDLLEEEWQTTDWRNTSTRSPFGEFASGVLLDNGVFDGIDVGSETTGSGRFHIQPCDFPGTREVLGETAAVGCVGLDDSSLNSGLRYDFNNFQTNNALGEGVDVELTGADAKGRQLSPDVKRGNAYISLTHELDDGIEIFGDALYYRSSTYSQRAAQPIDNGLAFIVIPASNYWNPFGAVGNPNRIDGLNNTPNEGLDILIRRWRPVEMGPRIFEVDLNTYRVLGGVRGTWNSWDWETALTDSQSKATDKSTNRISKTALAEQLALDTPEAINPFAGPYANSPEKMARIGVVVKNISKTRLTTWDFRASQNDLFELPAGPVGVAMGVEWRRESYTDDRDARLDGSIQFGDGEGSARSDVVGVSPTDDSSGSRNVWSAYGEILAPLVSPEMDIPLVHSIDLQLAVRAEAFSDIGEQVVKPKIALSWKPVEYVTFRGAYSRGFRAPNLEQLNRGDISRMRQGQEDIFRAPVTDDPDDTGETYRRSVRSSDPDLKPEHTETIVFGAEFHIPGDFDFRMGVDFWRFKQNNVIDNFGVEAALALDYLLRQEGSFNPNVVRKAVTDADQLLFDAWNASNPDDLRVAAGKVDFVLDPYANLDPRKVQGWDMYMQGTLDTDNLGRFRLNVELTKLTKWEQQRPSLEPLCNEETGLLDAGSDVCIDVVPDRRGKGGKPTWRASGALTWRGGQFGAGLSFRHTSGFIDTSADITAENGDTIFWQVEDYTLINGYVDVRFKNLGADRVKLRVGVNNIANTAPPLADESRGYFSSYHSNRGRTYYVDLSAKF